MSYDAIHSGSYWSIRRDCPRTTRRLGRDLRKMGPGIHEISLDPVSFTQSEEKIDLAEYENLPEPPMRIQEISLSEIALAAQNTPYPTVEASLEQFATYDLNYEDDEIIDLTKEPVIILD